MWYSDVSRRPWVIRHAASADGRKWTVTPRPALQLSQDWEAEVLVYPTVLQDRRRVLDVVRQLRPRGPARDDGDRLCRQPRRPAVAQASRRIPVLRPDPKRPWESNYVGSGCVLRLADGSFRYWYASRKEPPFGTCTSRSTRPAGRDRRPRPQPKAR